MKRNYLLLVLIYYGLVAFAEPRDSSFKSSVNNISSELIGRHIRFLGSDIFEGRGTGQPGGDLAAKYLAQEFNKAGLKPAGNNDTYYQYIPMHGSRALTTSKLILLSRDEQIELKLNDDYVLYRTGAQTFVPSPVPLVFAGYGITAPEFDYNDYQSIDVEGKIVVFLEGEPESVDPEYFNGSFPTIYSNPDAKQRIAISRGAAGSILIPNPFSPASSEWEKRRLSFMFEDITLAYSVSGNLSVMINPVTAEKLFEGSDFSLEDVFQMHFDRAMRSFPLQLSLSFKGDFVERDFVTANVVGMIEGSHPELKNTYVIISAHYDHLGIGPVQNGDSVYYGVLDNAIGTGVLLEIARAFSTLSVPPNRSVIFLLLTGEEKGLLGSTYYTDHPVVPLHKTVANINIDGVAMFEGFTSVVGVGAELSTLGEFLTAEASRYSYDVVDIPPQFSRFEAFNRSDQIAFAAAGIPSMLVLEGPDNKYFSREETIEKFIWYDANIYHTPSDNLTQDIDLRAAVQHAKFLFSLCYSISDSRTAPEWKEGIPFINARLRSIAERR